MTKFHLSYCSVSNLEMKELVDLMEQKPILPKIASITWNDDKRFSEEGDDWDRDLQSKLLKTFHDTFPLSKLSSFVSY
jgi:hypothetical protein